MKTGFTCTCEAGYKGEVIFCPLHAAAPEMYEALNDLVERLTNEQNRGLVFGYKMSISYTTAKRALAKANPDVPAYRVRTDCSQ